MSQCGCSSNSIVLLCCGMLDCWAPFWSHEQLHFCCWVGAYHIPRSTQTMSLCPARVLGTSTQDKWQHKTGIQDGVSRKEEVHVGTSIALIHSVNTYMCTAAQFCCNYVIWGSFVHVFDCQEGKGIHPCWAQWKLFFHATVLLMVVPNGQPLDTAFWGLKTLSIDHLLVAWQNIAGSWRQQPGVGGSCGCCTKYPRPPLAQAWPCLSTKTRVTVVLMGFSDHDFYGQKFIVS